MAEAGGESGEVTDLIDELRLPHATPQLALVRRSATE